ncbi:MAG: glycosyltransferase family 2 protein [Sideroxyarcus sp.]|nr:glycosyltransferase family 2 protein [Sideroxyarcus sp.]
MNKVTASVVLYNTPEIQLSRLLSCLEQAKIVQIAYLIDNSPTPAKCDLYALPWVTYIRSEKNVGYGAGHNMALRKVILSAEFHFVLNPDIYFEPEELQKMIARMKEDTSIGQLMPKVIYPDGSLQYLCKLIPTPVDLFFRRFLRGPLKELAQQKDEKFELRSTGYNREMDIPYLSGCFMLFRTSALRKIGLFDERFFMYPEDIDMTRRMHSEFRTIFFPGATIVHDHAKESYKSKKMLWIHLTNLIKYFNKWGWFFDAERKEVNAQTLKSLKE